MRYGFIIPFIENEDVQPTELISLAREAEDQGWDAIFFWDSDWYFSPWMILTAIALQTKHIQFGAILHPLPWRQPWLFARDTATLDQISDGRLIVAVGLGAVEDVDFARGRMRFGEPADRKVRAQLLDEGLEITNGLWSGEPFSYDGDHYQLDQFKIVPVPKQSPRIPIWAVGVWGKKKSMARVARCDGMLIHGGTAPAEITAIAEYVAARRDMTTPFDLVMEADTRGDTPEEAWSKVQAATTAGATWWLESMWTPPNSIEDARRRIRQGPPRATEV